MKRGAIAEGVLTIYRLVLISLIALVILGISSVFYSNYVDVRDTEAIILTRDIADCLTTGKFNLTYQGDLLNYCGYQKDRFFVNVTFTDGSGDFVKQIFGGDSGAAWIKELYKDRGKTAEIKQYVPGEFDEIYPFSDGKTKLNMEISVLVNEE